MNNKEFRARAKAAAFLLFIFLFAGPGMAEAVTVYVSTCGAGDYNTDGIDDHVEIDQALQYINSIGGGTVYITSGTYNINGSMYISSNTELCGDGIDNTIVRLVDLANWSGVLIPLRFKDRPPGYISAGTHENYNGLFRTPNIGIGGGLTVTNVRIHDFFIDGNYDNQAENQGDYHYNLIETGKVSNWTIENMKFSGSLYDQIRIGVGGYGGSSNILIQNNICLDSGHSNISLCDATNALIQNNDIICRINAGVRFTGVTNSTISYNNIHGGPGSPMGIEFSPNGSGKTSDNLILNNKINGQGQVGIILFGENLTSSAMANNTIIRGNIIYHNGFFNGTIWEYGIYVAHFDNTIIENNTIFNNNGAGIVFKDYPGAWDSYEPAKTVPWHRTAIVRNNIIANNTGYGLCVNTTNFTLINSYNYFYNNAKGAIDPSTYTTGGVPLDEPISLGIGDVIGTDPLFNYAYTRVYGPWPNNGLLDVTLDFHLKSQYGRWNGSGWVTDSGTSLAIARGDPASDNSKSPWGGIIEMGAYGNTAEASRSGPSVIVPQPPADDKSRTDAHAADPYVYPVPYIKGKHKNLTFSNLIIPSKIEIYSVDSTPVYEKEVIESPYSFVPEGFASGVYVYLIKNSKGTATGKIVIIR